MKNTTKIKAHTTLMKRAGLAFATLAAVMVLISPAAFADNGRRGHHYNNHYNDGPYRYNEYRHNHTHRYDWNSAYRYQDHCPRGLVETRRGCVPYGHAKRYQVGRPLPSYVEYHAVPHSTLKHLRPAPRGTRYVQVDRDVLLISEATKKVLDAIVLYSAVR